MALLVMKKLSECVKIGVYVMTNEKIKMKKTSSITNPARNNVLFRDQDDLLSSYLKEIANYPLLSATEEKEVAKKAKEGDTEAKKQLVKANLKLVITIARKAIHIAKIPMIDLIQEGNLGLMIAAEKFNWQLGFKFSTYASWWIKQSMIKAISKQAHCMKIPVYIQETLSKYSKIKAEMERQYNCQVKPQDVAKKMDISAEKIDSYLSAYSKTISIESGFEKEDGREFNIADMLEDEKSCVYLSVESEHLRKDIETVVSTLKEREQEVVKMRYGLGDFARSTLEEIGNLYGVTKECIRQTELRALKKIRASAFGQDVLSCYIQ